MGSQDAVVRHKAGRCWRDEEVCRICAFNARIIFTFNMTTAFCAAITQLNWYGDATWSNGCMQARTRGVQSSQIHERTHTHMQFQTNAYNHIFEMYRTYIIWFASIYDNIWANFQSLCNWYVSRTFSFSSFRNYHSDCRHSVFIWSCQHYKYIRTAMMIVAI